MRKHEVTVEQVSIRSYVQLASGTTATGVMKRLDLDIQVGETPVIEYVLRIDSRVRFRSTSLTAAVVQYNDA